MLSRRSLYILKLFAGSQRVTMEWLEAKTKLTKRQINYDIKLLNSWLEENGYKKITNIKPNSYLLNDDVSEIIKGIYSGDDQYTYDEIERKNLMFLYMYLNDHEISMFHFIDLLKVSRGTANDDLRKLEYDLKLKGLSIDYTREQGYKLVGNESDLQYVMMNMIVRIILYEEDYNLFQNVFTEESKELIEELKKNLLKNIRDNNLIINSNNFYIILYSFFFITLRSNDFRVNKNHYLASTVNSVKEFSVSKNSLDFNDNYEYKHIVLLTSLLLSYSTGDTNKKTSEYKIINETISNILIKMKRSYAVVLQNSKVFYQLYSHIRPALYRIIFNYPMINPIKDEIIEQYQSLFIIISEVINSLGFSRDGGMSDDELSYLTIHFATFLSKEFIQNNEKVINGVIICPNGIGISVLLYQELTNLFPNINFLETTSIDMFYKIKDDVDVVFSTQLIQTDKPLFLVNPVMNNIEKVTLVNNFNSKFKNNSYIEKDVIKSFLQIIERYADITDKNGLLREVNNFFSKNNTTKTEGGQPMLSELITEDLVQLNVMASDWKDVIKKSAQPLVDNKKITKKYVDAMIKNTENGGPYIVITKHVALPHARPEEGAIEVGLSVTTLKEPIEFGNEINDPVKFVFCLSAVDNTTHLKALSELVDLLSDKEFYKAMENAESALNITNFIKNKEQKFDEGD